MKIYNNIHSQNNYFNSKPSFKGEFDKYAYISQKIVNARIANERRRQAYTISSYDSDISRADNQLSSLKGQIRSLKSKIEENDRIIDDLKQEGNDIVNKVCETREQVKDLSENNPILIKNYYEARSNIQKDINEKTFSTISEIAEKTKNECGLMEAGFKNQSIKRIINPILQLDKEIPSSIYIENTSGKSGIKETIAAWLCNLTNSNSERIDAQTVENPQKLISEIKKLLLLAYRNFEQNGQWTLIFIDHINSLNTNSLEHSNITFLTKILSSCSKFYHSSIVAISDKPKEQLLSQFKFTEHLILDNAFIQDANVGLKSLTKDLLKKKI